MIETTDILVEAISEAIETMAFLDVFPVDDEMSIPEKPMLGEISFAGPKSGTIEVLMDITLCRTIAENIGALEQVDDNIAFDALKELSNVTCGLLLPMIAESQEDMFDITVPKVIGIEDAPHWNDFISHQDCTVLNIEGSAIAVRLNIEK